MATRAEDLSPVLREALWAVAERYRREAIPLVSCAPWRDRVRATLYSLHRFLAADEGLARFLLVELRFEEESARLRAERWMEGFFDLIDEGRGEPTAPAGLNRTTAEGLGGGIYVQLFAAIVRDGSLPPEGKIVPELMYCVVLPYCGREAAREELGIPRPPSPPVRSPRPRPIGVSRG